MSERRLPPETSALFAAHVRLIREMGDEDDPANDRSTGILYLAADLSERLAEFYHGLPGL
jgi:hypothetical protein